MARAWVERRSHLGVTLLSVGRTEMLGLLRPPWMRWCVSAFAAVAIVCTAAGGVRATATPRRVPRVVLNNGMDMPMLSLGIWQFSDEEVAAVVPLALSLGYDFIDASIFYGVPENDGRPNQPALGRALAGIPRASYSILTKIDPSYVDSAEYSIVATPFSRENAYYRTLEQAAHNLADLALNYVDVMLVHWSVADCGVMRETWRAMEQVYRLGMAKAVPEFDRTSSRE